ncbi:MAG: type II toxin-antitoxin system Phd/YefM family antitoxin [Chloroflexia bacterium]|nr:type II toxin-antitoxin system Phd/YefM family antitoxin [Chloroflexia bacterium]
MPKTVAANEAKNRLGALLAYVSEEGDEVIVENHGKPKAVIMSIYAYQEVEVLREKQRRADILDRLRALREEVRARNQDLTEDQANALAVRFSREMIDDLAAEGKLVFERDLR